MDNSQMKKITIMTNLGFHVNLSWQMHFMVQELRYGLTHFRHFSYLISWSGQVKKNWISIDLIKI